MYSGRGRQPIHLKAGVQWYLDEKDHKWSALSVVLHLNDGYQTFLCGRPVASIFTALAKKGRKNPEFCASQFKSLLKKMDNKFDLPQCILSRAGQMTCFHPGEQFQCGVGPAGYMCGLTGLKSRVVFCCTAVPKKYKPVITYLKLFNSELPWGLFHDVTVEQVSLKRQTLNFVFLLKNMRPEDAGSKKEEAGTKKTRSWKKEDKEKREKKRKRDEN